MSEKEIKYAKSFREQFTLRGVLIGIVGAVIITTSSMYIALKASSLPWPIIFVALVSMFGLKLCGNTNINEINVTHTIMSAGAMVAGGMAFTIPGIWMLGIDTGADTGFKIALLAVALGGVVLGLIFTAFLRKFFIETENLPFPMGQAAADTLIVGDKGGKGAGLLFGAMALSAVWTALRDWFMKIPAVVTGGLSSPGINYGIYMSPMMMAVGYIIGPLLLGVWFIGAIIGNFGVVWGGTTFGGLELDTALGIKSSLGIGVMVGTGFGIVIKGILPKLKSLVSTSFLKAHKNGTRVGFVVLPIVFVVLAFVFTYILDMGLVASIITILGVWLTTAMSAQILGQTGINPMEIFGVIVLLACKAATSIGQLEAFFVAAVVAVACGLVGDVMNDFKVGHIVHSDPKAQWLGEAIGGVIGAVISVIVLFILLKAYGPGAFGNPEVFPAAQAGVVASMVQGIASMPAFLIGLGAGIVLYCLNLPVMTLGIGIYLPLYLSATAFLGGVIKVAIDLIVKLKDKNKPAEQIRPKGNGLIVAAGLMGGEAITGVIIALIMVCLGLGAI